MKRILTICNNMKLCIKISHNSYMNTNASTQFISAIFITFAALYI